MEVEDNASPTISEVESRVHRLGNVRALTRAEVDDQATEKVNRITQRIKDLTKKVFSPVIKLRDLTASTVGKIKQRLKEIATTFTPIVKIRDLASQGLAKIKNTLGGLEYASMNAQSVIGQGVSTFTDDGSTNMAVVTGATSGLGNGSGIDPNAGVDGKCSVSYRGEENLWGNIWTWLDAINIYNDKASRVYNAFVKPYGECKDDTTADGYKALDFNIATGEGYISGFGYDEDHPDLFLCAEHNGASNLPVGDYYWNNNDGFRVARLGGIWSSGALCGAWYLYLYGASSYRYRGIGGRLLYVPQTKISA